ncbi:MAG: SPASM domain-containing protein, partial [Chlamydiae bacterium]|nr:SPASM domain-containing protein [Chlamydiota bacterium]
EMRMALDIILKWTRSLKESGFEKEILTVGNPVDGVYLYLKLKEEKEGVQAQEVLDLISLNGGGQFGSGVGLGCIDFYGNVHPDQFSMGVTLGNVKERPFSQIWMDLNNELLRGLKNRLPLLKGKCELCDWKNQCGGGLRTRAHLAFGDPWAEDPGCYLTSEEVHSSLASLS